MLDIQSPSCSSPYNQAAMMTGTATSASAPEYCPTTVMNAGQPSIEAEPLPSSSSSNLQHLSLPADDETMNPQSATDFQLATSSKDKERDAIMPSAVDMGVQDADGTIVREKGERGGGVVMDEAAELKFMPFPKLPTELRLKIWKHALPGPRVVEIEWNPDTKQWFSPFESQSERSNLCCTNRESREVSHQIYLPLVKVSRVVTHSIVPDAIDPFHETSQHTTSYLNSTIDILYIGPCLSNYFCVTLESFKVLAASPWMQKVRLLAIEYKEFDQGESRDAGIEMHHKIFSLLPNLTEIIVVVGDIDYEYLLSDAHHWSGRPHAEIGFIDAEDRSIPPWVDVMASSYNKKFSRGDGLKFSTKKILRGGVIPESIGGYRWSHCRFSSDSYREGEHYDSHFLHGNLRSLT